MDYLREVEQSLTGESWMQAIDSLQVTTRTFHVYPSDIMLLYPSDIMLLYPSDGCFFTLPTATSLPFQQFLLHSSRWVFYPSNSCLPTVHSPCWVFTLLTAASQLFTFFVGFLPFQQLLLYPCNSCFSTVHCYWGFTLLTAASQVFTLLPGFLPFQHLLLQYCSLFWLGFYHS